MSNNPSTSITFPSKPDTKQDLLPQSIFPTAGSLQEVLELGESRLPITNKNELRSLLATYHNTLLAKTGS